MINAMTFDIEEYFHAEAFAGVVRPEEWPVLESRVGAATLRLLDILEETRSASRSWFEPSPGAVMKWPATATPTR
jgi:hypothetical protein